MLSPLTLLDSSELMHSVVSSFSFPFFVRDLFEMTGVGGVSGASLLVKDENLLILLVIPAGLVERMPTGLVLLVPLMLASSDFSIGSSVSAAGSTTPAALAPAAFALDERTATDLASVAAVSLGCCRRSPS